MCVSMCHAKAHVLTELMQLSRGCVWLPYLRISRGKPPEAVLKNHTPCRVQFSGSVHCGTPCWLKALKNSPLAQIQSCSAWLKMEAPLLILTLAVVSIPIVSLAAVLLLLPVARKRFTSFIIGLHECVKLLLECTFVRNPMVFSSGGRRSKVLELEMNSMLDARLRQFYSRMIDLKGDDDEVIFL